MTPREPMNGGERASTGASLTGLAADAFREGGLRAAFEQARMALSAFLSERHKAGVEAGVPHGLTGYRVLPCGGVPIVAYLTGSFPNAPQGLMVHSCGLCGIAYAFPATTKHVVQAAKREATYPYCNGEPLPEVTP